VTQTTSRSRQTSVTAGARAYGGPAHGHRWAVPAADPPDRVVLGAATCYRLVHGPRTHLPARDHLGNYLYMPVRHGFAPGRP
jgi:hypothetical protein